MNNPKYDETNYLKHGAVIIGTSDFRQLETLFYASTLLIKWQTIGSFKSLNSSDLIGTIRLSRDTPLGAERPRDYQIKVDRLTKNEDPYINFLEFNLDSELPYLLSISNPVGVPKTQIEIWEYQPPANFLNSNNVNMSGTYGNDQIIIDNSAITAAIAASNVTTVAAINALPGNIADSIANNAMTTSISNPIAIGITPVTVFAAAANRQVVEIANRGNTKLRVIVSDAPPVTGTTYANAPFTVELIAAVGAVGSAGYKPGGTWVADTEQAKSAIYVISDNPNGSIVTTVTATAP